MDARLYLLSLVALALAGLSGCTTAPRGRTVASSPSVSGRTSGADRLLPDRTLTPGALDPGCDREKVCVPGYSDGNADEEGARNVDDATKRQAFDRYGIQNPVTADYEVDHLISLELCGSNAIENLWPESYKPVPGAHEKDRVEDSLHDEVCKGTKTLQEAQEIIRTDWYAEYQRIEAGTSGAAKKPPRRTH